MKQALKIILASALVTGIAIKAVPALAQEAVNVTIVRTADLDLNSADGQRALRDRLGVAAHSVCDGASAADLKALNSERECRSKVIAEALDHAEQIAQRGSAASIVLASGD